MRTALTHTGKMLPQSPRSRRPLQFLSVRVMITSAEHLYVGCAHTCLLHQLFLSGVWSWAPRCVLSSCCSTGPPSCTRRCAPTSCCRRSASLGGKKPRELHIPADDAHAKCLRLHLMALNRGMTPGLAGGVVLSLP